jgi:hypothetical protein
MMRSRFLRSSVLVLSVFVALSCSDSSPTAPATAPVSAIRAGTQQDALLGGLLGGLVGGLLKVVTSVVAFVANANVNVNGVAWNSSYTHVSHTVSGTISPWGGTLTIPQSDFTIVFPVGAVSHPHMTFAKPVVVTQRLRNTVVYGKPLTTKIFGAYVDDASVDLLGTIFNALEIELSATLYVPGSSTLPDITTWTENHFSRYMLASG